MASQFLDQYTYLHFATGIIFYFWGISFTNSFILHSIYEYFEITDFGTKFINTYLGNIWPGGGKHKQEKFIYNGLGDTIGFIIGWVTSYYIDRLGKNMGWYDLHIE